MECSQPGTDERGESVMALDVHLHGAKVASLRREGDRYALAYDEEAVEPLGADRTRLSLALPPRGEPHGAEETSTPRTSTARAKRRR